MHPELVVWQGGVERGRVGPPAAIAPRAWALGVVAVQAGVRDGRPSAQARWHATGAGAPTIVPLGDAALVHVALGACDPATLPRLVPPPLDDGAVARLAVWLDGALVDGAALPAALLGAEPPPRGFSHAFCRWLRDGGLEPGFDLTDFVSQPEGRKFERRVVRPFAPGQVVSIGWRAR